MKITQEQHWYLAQYCLENYSVNALEIVGRLMYSQDAVAAMYHLTLQEPSEDEFLAELRKLKRRE